MDAESQILIEQAIAYAERLYEIREIPIYQRWDDKAKNDFQLIDFVYYGTGIGNRWSLRKKIGRKQYETDVE